MVKLHMEATQRADLEKIQANNSVGVKPNLILLLPLYSSYDSVSLIHMPGKESITCDAAFSDRSMK